MEAFWLSLGMIFLAELGDKTQLVALSLSTRFNPRVVLSAILAATLAVHLFSVGLGGLVGKLMPKDWILFVTGLAFIGFGFWTIRGDSLDDDGETKHKARSPFWIVAITFFLAELGDKTMISTVTLAAKDPILPVWLGSSLGMVLSDGLAVMVGIMLNKKLPERAIKIGASVIFFGYGIVSMVQAGSNIPVAAWGVAGLAIAAASYFIFKKKEEPVTC